VRDGPARLALTGGKARVVYGGARVRTAFAVGGPDMRVALDQDFSVTHAPELPAYVTP
jgi:hypothetical protein